VNQARIFQDLGFDKPALVKGWKSVTIAPDNFSAHRFLSDSYAALPRQNIARTSELLQSQLLAPINDTPLQPQLAESNLAILENSGPLAAAYNEYNPMFISDGVRLQLNGLYGNNDTWGNDAVFSGINDKLSYSLGQFHYETDGFRDNNDNEEDLYNGFLQYAISPQLNVQGEFRRRETDQGDLRLNFDPELFSDSRRRKVNQSTYRLGGHYEPTLSSDVLVSYIYSDTNEKLAVPGDNEPDLDSEEVADARQLEAQFLYRQHRYNIVAGGGRYDVDYTGGTVLDWTPVFPFACPPSPPFPPVPCLLPAQPDSQQDAVYLYSNITYPRNLTWTLGLGYDSVELYNDDNDRYSPKLGAQWDISSGTRLRLAYFESVKRSLVVEQSIEPTQVSGFNQFYDENNGSRSDNYGAAIDAHFSAALYSGLEYMRRDVDVQQINTEFATKSYEKREEDSYRAYFNWALNKRLALTAEYRLEKIDNGNNPGPRQLDTASVPVGLNFFHPDGIFASVGVSYVDQEIKRQFSSQRESDDFTLVDVSLGYRLPKRYGIIGVEVQNLFDKNFSYQDRNFMTSELVPPEYIPDRTILGRISLNF
ncbi:MAG: TonB-dependent receptor, partial [Pseudomonadota bacterium]|nr:TonB-dependent receptor [Pseudomonadota bacterium]